MALLIHRSSPRTSVEHLRLLLVGGDGRWARPLLRLLEGLGVHADWLEGLQPESADRFVDKDLILVGDPRTARWYLDRLPEEGRPPVVVMTGSLHGLSTAIAGDRSQLPASVVPLPLPITLESLRSVIAQDPGDSRPSPPGPASPALQG